VSRKQISTRHQAVSCDVCGRTLLRGEHAEQFLAGGSRRQVCELCTQRAAHEGWIREGLSTAGGVHARGRERRGSLLRRLRRRDDAPAPVLPATLSGSAPESAPLLDEWPADELDPLAEPAETAAVEPAYAEPSPAPSPAQAKANRLQVEIERVNRTVHAVPTNTQMKLARALEIFNRSDAPQRVSGIARSLGAPIVVVRPSMTEGSIVAIVIAWELCWYRYEVDLADEASGVRLVSQGAELEELPAEEQTANAAADERGGLVMAA
jgi:hypothetical protein